MSNDRLNQAALRQYASAFARQILDNQSGGKTTFDGTSLLEITPLRQVNLGVIYRVFVQWKTDAEAFRSPYFDFESNEVQKALQEFMNLVSQHISLQAESLGDLIAAATEDALRLLFSPADYFEVKLRALPGFRFGTVQARELDKYTHIHAGVAKNLMQRLTDSGTDFVYVNEALNWLAESIESGEYLDAPQVYVAQFSSIAPLNVDALFDNNPAVFASMPDSAQAPAGASFFDSELVTQEKVPPSTELDVTRPGGASTPATSSTGGSLGGIDSRSNSINNRFKVEIPASAREVTYGNVTPKVNTILGSIALGQRFMFINQLFDRNNDAFDEAIRQLDRAKTKDEALSFLHDTLAPTYRWDIKSAAASELIAIVQRKFN